MANIKISALPEASSVLNTDEFPINQSGTTKKTKLSTLANSIETTIINNNNTNGLIKKPSTATEGQILKYVGGQWVAANESTGGVITPTSIYTGKTIAKGYFKTINLVTDTAMDQTKFLTVAATRVGTSQYVTINYSGLPAKYKDPANPFFVENQFVGVTTIASKMAGRIYKIEQHNPTANTFVIDTVGAAIAFSQNIQLSLVVDNIDGTNQNAYGIKSIYIDMTSPSKYYVNFREDVFTKSKINTTPVEILNMLIVGQGYTDARSLLTPVMLFNANRATAAAKEAYVYHVNVGEGYGATSMGVHMGFFYNYINGADTNRISNAAFSIMV